MKLPIIAIVGPPNAGKSTLLNKITGKSLAVTSEIAGTTRDRQYIDTVWNGRIFSLVDTAGLGFLNNEPELEESVKKQIDVATKEADALLFVVDGKTADEHIDRQVLLKFRKIKKPVILAVNKLDSPNNLEAAITPFYKLGIKNVFPISSVTGRGIGDLLDHIVSILPDSVMPAPEPASSAKDLDSGIREHDARLRAGSARPKVEQAHVRNDTGGAIAVAIVGKPNVGKSSIFNKILKDDRVVVSSIPGTTRTAIDSNIEINGIGFTFIDTAGLKKKEHRQAKPDIYSGFQTYKSIRRSDVCFFVIDSTEEITKQDQAIAQEIFHQDKGCIIVATKIDAFVSSPGRRSPVALAKGEKEKSYSGDRKYNDDKYQTLKDYISHHFPFLWMSPLFFVSGKTGEGLQEAIAAIQPIYERRNKKVSGEDLQALLTKWVKKNPPKLLRDQKAPKVYGLKQLLTNPPLFELTVNSPGAISTQFRKSIQNAIIKELDFWGTPVNLTLRKKV